jgi:hypothetical protein
MPANTICVSRPSKWGNPCTRDHYDLSEIPISDRDWVFRQLATRDFAALLHLGRLPFTEEDVRRELRGFNLACWCPTTRNDQSIEECHADVLFEIANWAVAA